MDLKETIAALEWLKVETGSLACLGCGHEHNCSIHGCAIIRSAAELLQMTAHTFPEPALLKLAAKYLDTTPERLRELAQAEKNEPLTLEELREMEGEATPVWCDKVNGYVFIAATETEPYNQVWFFNHKGFAYTVLYYHTKFYRRKPKGETE